MKTADGDRAEVPPANPRPASWSRPVALVDRGAGFLDACFDRLYTSAYNPLHQSGTIAIVAFLTLIVTGIYLFLFYSIDSPYASVARIENEVVAGRWTRAVHAYAADVAIVAALLHAVKMFLAGRAWGPRARAWVTGVLLVGLTLLCGWTGHIMAWDLQGQVVATQLTKLLDLLPVFSMPMSRAFTGLDPVPGSFFFMNLFLHVCLPLGGAVLLWIHVAHLARPQILPPRPLTWSFLAVLAVLAAVVPVPLGPEADLLAVPTGVPVDLVYNFWIPLAWNGGPVLHAAAWGATGLVFVSVPWWWRKRRGRPEPSSVDADLCTGCTTCYQDCPFDAITMIEREDRGRRSEFVALVNPDRCVACGICAGSCAPMGVGPPQFTGRAQLAREQEQSPARGYAPGTIVTFVCRQSGLSDASRLAELGPGPVRPIECAGNLHTSVIEYALRSGASGVMVLTCAARSAPCREGPKWLFERVYNDREAELPARVDKRRVALVGGSRGEWAAIQAAREALDRRIESMTPGVPEPDVEVGVECEPKRVVRRA